VKAKRGLRKVGWQPNSRLFSRLSIAPGDVAPWPLAVRGNRSSSRPRLISMMSLRGIGPVSPITPGALATVFQAPASAPMPVLITIAVIATIFAAPKGLGPRRRVLRLRPVSAVAMGKGPMGPMGKRPVPRAGDAIGARPRCWPRSTTCK